MKKIYAIINVSFAIIAALLVFSNVFHTPPLSIVISSILGIVFGFSGWHEIKILSGLGIAISLISILYLIYLYAGLAF